jgi:hypothetical protein
MARLDFLPVPNLNEVDQKARLQYPVSDFTAFDKNLLNMKSADSYDVDSSQ